MNEYMHGQELIRRYKEGERDFQNANLSSANLLRADQHGADLRGAELSGANLQEANFDENTTLPDGTKWTSDTDTARFADYDHPDLWHRDVW